MTQNNFSRFRALFTSLIISTATLLAVLQLAGPQVAASPAAAVESIDSTLPTQPPAAGEHGRFIIEFTPHAISSAADTPAPPAAHRAQLNALQETAAAAQQATLQTLQEMQSSGNVSRIRPLWIINAIAVSGSVTAVHQLAADPAVRLIRPDPIVQSLSPGREDDTISQLLATTGTPYTEQNWGVPRIGAPHVWHGLGIDGAGVTVAIMDSGVAWQHPDLLPNYRGNQGSGQYAHAGNWIDITDPTQNEPIDLIGHGTHVAGIAVGQGDIGVAPGATWIAVKIADQWGNIYESDAHAAFQWLLAPNGDPDLAPDIVNGSWGSSQANDAFAPDIALLRQAGILPVFAAGNAGPDAGTVGTPGGLEHVIAIGASTVDDAIANFSSRGPSSLTGEQKPWLVAPGTEIYSTLPGGEYGLKSGTSMATPAMSGALALLLAAAPSLTEGEIRQITAETAAPIHPPHPNNDAGYGRLQIYAAVQQVITTGTLTGIVRENGTPLADIPVTISNSMGMTISFRTGTDGRFTAALQPGSYDLRVDNFLYNSVAFTDLTITADQTRTQDISLTRKPTGRISGRIQDSQNQPLSGVTIQVQETAIYATSGSDGRYELLLPTGDYALRVVKSGYRAPIQPVTVTAGATQTADFTLAAAPTILLVDGGAWYYGSMVHFYTATLQQAEYNYDIWTVKTTTDHLPMAADLEQYETVIWSAPLDSPGFIGADAAVSTYLDNGGNLFIAGQEVGYLDGNIYNSAEWWSEKLAGYFLGERTNAKAITGGPDTPFNGITLEINGAESARNQEHPDVSAPRTLSNTTVAMLYEDGNIAGLYAGKCQPFNILYMGVGLEGVGDIDGRVHLLDQAITTLNGPPTGSGLTITPSAINEFALPGDQLVYTFTVQNSSETRSDTFAISYHSADFSGSLVTQTLHLEPCGRGQTVLRLSIPGDFPPDAIGEAGVTAVSSNNPSQRAESLISLKTAGDLLFVDDYRFYPRGDQYTAALDALGLVYDRVDSHNAADQQLLERADFLQAYKLIIWYTGYDWYAPITPAEASALAAFITNGGRLFLSSQDFQYYHNKSFLNRAYLDVFDHREYEDIEALHFYHSPFFGHEFPPIVPLDFGPYINNADGLIPGDQSIPLVWGDQGLPTAVGSSGPGWRSIFWGIPWETIPEAQQTAVMRDSLAWLSDLGDSTITADRRSVNARESVTFTLLLQNSGTIAREIVMKNPLPPNLTLIPASINGNALFNAVENHISWSGTLPAGTQQTITYQMQAGTDLTPGTPITNSTLITVVNGLLPYPVLRQTVVWADAPTLQGRLAAVPNAPISADKITYTLMITNAGRMISDPIDVDIRIPDDVSFVSGTLETTVDDWSIWWGSERQLHCRGVLTDTAQIQFVTQREVPPTTERLLATAVLDDGITRPVLVQNGVELSTHELLLLTVYNANWADP